VTTADEPRAPDLIEPVVGFRQWRLGGQGLRSIVCDETWREATLVARCLAGGHPEEAAPATACSCGVHAWYELTPRTASAASDYVAGAVLLWGAIELHATGMRAQHCRIVALALPLSRWGKRRRVVDVAQRLGVPAVRHRDLRAVARQHGAPVATDLRPAAVWLRGGPSGAIPDDHCAESWFRRSARPHRTPQRDD
jgi:hypothetical protein